MASCAKCGRELLLEAVLPGAAGQSVVMTGTGLELMGERLVRQPRACPNCQKNFCTSCANQAAKQLGKENVAYACPECGTVLGVSVLDRPSYIANPAPAPKPVPAQPVAPPAAPIPQAGPALLSASRTKLNAAWVTNLPGAEVRQRLQAVFTQDGMTLVSERDADGREIVVDQGSQFTTRMGGALFVDPKSLPKRAVIVLKPTNNGVSLNVTIGETLGVGLFDPGTQNRYETYFREWFGELMRALPPLDPAANVPLTPIAAPQPGAAPAASAQSAQPVYAPSASIQRSPKNRGTAMLLEILPGLIGLPGIGWLYGGRGTPGVILLVGFFVWNIIAAILIAATGGIALLCTIPIWIGTVVTSSILLNKYINQHPEIFAS
jgi:hypothetical protein